MTKPKNKQIFEDPENGKTHIAIQRDISGIIRDVRKTIKLNRPVSYDHILRIINHCEGLEELRQMFFDRASKERED